MKRRAPACVWAYPKWLDKHLPPCGPCAICGGEDARHRMVDAIQDRVLKAGESVKFVAADYGLPLAFVRRIVKLVESRRGEQGRGKR